MYADDAAIVSIHREMGNALNMLQDDFNNVLKWTHDHGLVVNANKSKIMHIRLPHLKNENCILIFHEYDCLHQNKLLDCEQESKCKINIECVEKYKYLGVTIDQHLKWYDHINSMECKLRKSLFAFKRLSLMVQKDVQRLVYFSLVESTLRYGIMAWGGTADCHISKLIKIQNRFIKIIALNTQQEFLETTEKYKWLFILKVTQVYKMVLLSNYYNCNEYREEISHPKNTRRKKDRKVVERRFINSYGKQELRVEIPKILNELPNNIRWILNKNIMKKEVKKFLINGI